MLLETRIVIYVCPICQRTYKLKEDARQCERLCAKLLKSPDISVLGLSSRTYNLLKIAGIDTLDELLEISDYQLLKIKRFGKGALNELHEKVQTFKAKANDWN